MLANTYTHALQGWGLGEKGGICKRVQTFSYKMKRSEDLMYNVTMIDNTVLYK